MCSRETLSVPAARIVDVFGCAPPPGYRPRYNIAPTEPILAIRSEGGIRSSAWLRWDLIPAWTRPGGQHTPPLVNARAERVATKPSFRYSFRSYRCLVPADGYFEWRQEPDRRQPFYVRRPDRDVFAFAGLWARWLNPEAKAVESCAIITTRANDQLRWLHDRMPVILDQKDYSLWLGADSTPTDLLGLLRPVPDGVLEVFAVSELVNSARVDDPRCIEPVSTPDEA